MYCCHRAHLVVIPPIPPVIIPTPATATASVCPTMNPPARPALTGSFCDGDEFCNEAGICTPGISLCDDGIACTADLCDEETAVCTSDPVSCGLLELNLHNERTCFSSGQDLCVTIDVRNLYGQDMIGGQFFLEYDACLLDLLAIAPGDHSVPGISPCPTSGLSPFSAEIFKAGLGGRLHRHYRIRGGYSLG